jgi:hypothetical protein
MCTGILWSHPVAFGCRPGSGREFGIVTAGLLSFEWLRAAPGRPRMTEDQRLVRVISSVDTGSGLV